MDITNSSYEDIINEIENYYANSKYFQDFLKECDEIFQDDVYDDKYLFMDYIK